MSAPKSRATKTLYTPLVRRLTYCGAVSGVHLQTLYGGDLRRIVPLADTGRLTLRRHQRLLRWLGEYQAETRSTTTNSRPLPYMRFTHLPPCPPQKRLGRVVSALGVAAFLNRQGVEEPFPPAPASSTRRHRGRVRNAP